MTTCTWRGRLVLVLYAVLLTATGCSLTHEDVTTLDVSRLEPDEGIFVARVFTSEYLVKDGIEMPRDNLDIHYWMSYGPSEPWFVYRWMQWTSGIEVRGNEGPLLITRKCPAGDYYFSSLRTDTLQYRSAINLRFTVAPGQVTYVGDLKIQFDKREDWHAIYSFLRYRVDADEDATRAMLQERFPEELPELVIQVAQPY